MHFHIVTLFPDACTSYFEASIIARAIKEKKIRISFYNPRDFTKDPHKRVDRRPYGGGPGMVLEPESVLRAVQKALGKKNRSNTKILFFEPHGRLFDTAFAQDCVDMFAHVVMICGRYEGIDARVKEVLGAEGVSIGHYTLTGGELPAMVLVDCITRRIKGVLGSDESVEERRVAGGEVYTRPEVLIWQKKKYPVPKVLLSGNHKEIEDWKGKK